MKKTIVIYFVLVIILLLTFREFKQEPTLKIVTEKTDTIRDYSVLNDTIILDEVIIVGYKKSLK
jgi:hypothetical protein